MVAVAADLNFAIGQAAVLEYSPLQLNDRRERKRETIVGKVHDKANYEAASVTVIKMIAAETKRPFAEVKRVYDEEFARLKSSARVTDYLVVFATRRTRSALAQTA